MPDGMVYQLKVIILLMHPLLYLSTNRHTPPLNPKISKNIEISIEKRYNLDSSFIKIYKIFNFIFINYHYSNSNPYHYSN